MRRSGQRKNRAALLEKWATRHGYSGDAPEDEDEVGAAPAAATEAGGDPHGAAAATLEEGLQAQLLEAQHEREAARAELERAQSAAAAESESLKEALNTLASQLVETKIAMATAARDDAHGGAPSPQQRGEGARVYFVAPQGTPLDAPLALPMESVLGVGAAPEQRAGQPGSLGDVEVAGGPRQVQQVQQAQLRGTPRRAGGVAVDAAGSPGDVDRLRDLLVTKLHSLQPSLARPAETTSATPGTARLMEAADSEIADARTWRQLMSGGLHTEQQQQQQQQMEQRAGVTWLAGAEEQVDGVLQSNSTQHTTTQVASHTVAASSPATPVSNPDPLPGRSEGGQGGAPRPASTLQRASGREEDLEKRKWDLLQKLSHAHRTSPTHGSYPRNSPFLAKQRKLLETMSALSKFIPSIPNNPAVNMHSDGLGGDGDGIGGDFFSGLSPTTACTTRSHDPLSSFGDGGNGGDGGGGGGGGNGARNTFNSRRAPNG